MSEETKPELSALEQRTLQQREPWPKLAPAARNTFRWMVGIGIAALTLGGVIFLAGIAQAGDAYGAEAEYYFHSSAGAFFQWATLGVPFFVGAGVVAGLGKREAEQAA